MANHERDFDPPRIMLVKQVGAGFDFGLLPRDFKYFDSFQMVCAGVVVRSSERGHHLCTSHRSMLPAGTTAAEQKQWQERAISFVTVQWQAYIGNDFKLPGYQRQEEAFNEIVSHSVRNLGTDIMTEEEIDRVEEALHVGFMRMLDSVMARPTKGLTGRYAMGGNA
jgi:hypothetical protein